MDVFISVIGLFVLWPLLLIVCISVLIFMPNGPVLFKQRRIGQFGKPFTIYKFRTMRVEHSGSSISMAGESRITRLGSFLRKYKLDELPELWNVIIGDMSLVGPRPDVPGYADLLKGNERKILNLKPGITGPASLKYINEEYILSQQENAQKYNDEVIYPDKVRVNLKYYENWSLLLDMKIIWFTIIRKQLHEF